MHDEQGALLLQLARGSLRHTLCDAPVPRQDAAWLAQPGATFVTLMQEGALRGCIGTLEAWRPLGEDVVANARAAALHDWRFEPLRRDDLDDVRIEVSLLSVAESLPDASRVFDDLRPGVDGLTVRHAQGSGTFLPQVWTQLPDPVDFFAQLLRKARLHEVPLEQCRFERYTVRKWCEPDTGTNG
jgi:AmmeMemoRadiSam system protein A